MAHFLSNILRSPDNGEPLQYDAAANEWTSLDGSFRYSMLSAIPVLLSKEAAGKTMQAEQHRHLNTQFSYTEHYQTDAELFDYFDVERDGGYIHESRRLHEVILSELPAHTATVLDAGCGSAWVAQHLCPRGISVVSMDISTVNPLRAMERYPYENHAAVVADVYALPFQEGAFDAIIASEIIEHVADPGAFIRALLPALKPGGALIITTPYAEKIIYSLCIHCNQPTPMHAHLHSFTADALLALTPKPLQHKTMVYAFGNKALIRLQTHVVLRFLPFGLWRLVDKLANLMVKKPSRLLLRVSR